MPLRRLYLLVAVAGAMLALPAPAAAHHLIVDPPGGGTATDHWVGGPEAGLPGSAGGNGLHEAPFGLLPAAHSAGPNDDKGLVQACESTRSNPSAVSFVPPGPPGFVDCHHGPP